MKKRLTKKESKLLCSIARRYDAAIRRLDNVEGKDDLKFSTGYAYGYITAMVYDLENLGIISYEEQDELCDNSLFGRKTFFEIIKVS